jgi:outer membrane protein TolC
VRALLLGAVLCATSAVAEPLGESEAVRRALSCSPSRAVAAASLRAAESERDAARWGLVPDLAISARYTRLSSVPARFRAFTFALPGLPQESFEFPQLLDQYAARASLTVPVTDVLLRAVRTLDAAGARVEARALDARAARDAVEVESRAAWHVWRRAEVAVALTDDSLALLDAQRRDARARVDAGTLPPTQLRVLEVEHAGVQRERLGLEQQRDLAVARLQRLLCDDAPWTHRPGPPEAHPAPIARAELRALDAEGRALDAAAAAQRAAAVPALALVAGVDLAAPNPRAFGQSTLETLATWDVTVQVSWSFPGAMGGLAQSQALAAQRDAIQARRREVALALAEERRAARVAGVVAAEGERLAAQSLDAATALTAARRAEFAAGVASALELTAAEGQRRRAALALEDARIERDLAALRARAAEVL